METATIRRTYAPDKYREWWLNHWDLFVKLHRTRTITHSSNWEREIIKIQR